MDVTKKQKIIRAIPGLIVGSLMTGIIIWGITSDKRCKELLKKDNCITQIVYCKYSKKGLSGNGVNVKTGFTNPTDTSIYFLTQAFRKPLPEGLPIAVRYSPECPDCYEFLWDSIVISRDNEVRYFEMKDEGIDYEIIRITN
jgi:hypothetical protein